jgi:hypothetical protein
MNQEGEKLMDPIVEESVVPLKVNIEQEKDKLIEKPEAKDVVKITDAVDFSKGEIKTTLATDDLNLVKKDHPSKDDQNNPKNVAITINTEEKKSPQPIVILLEAGKSESSNEIVNAEGLKRKADDIDDNSSSSKQKKASRKSSSQLHLKMPIWYNSISVDALEVKNMPEFFSTETAYVQNAKDYLTMRNSIVSLYSNSPYIYLSATDCRKKITGDVCAVLKIHSFLDAFGVINFNVKAESRPSMVHPTLSHWCTDPETTSSSSTSTATDMVDYENIIDWSEAMDRSLKCSIVANCGDWVAVSEGLYHEFPNLVTDDSSRWKPTSEECLARFLSLALIPSSFIDDTLNHSSQQALTSIAGSEADQKIRFLSSEIATRAARALGCSTAQQIISDVLKSCEVINPFVVLF